MIETLRLWKLHKTGTICAWSAVHNLAYRIAHLFWWQEAWEQLNEHILTNVSWWNASLRNCNLKVAVLSKVLTGERDKKLIAIQGICSYLIWVMYILEELLCNSVRSLKKMGRWVKNVFVFHKYGFWYITVAHFLLITDLLRAILQNYTNSGKFVGMWWYTFKLMGTVEYLFKD